MFTDKVLIHARAGRGGNGSHSFRRETFVPKGGPDGGDGGNGGNIILEVDAAVNNLNDFKFQPHIRAPEGGHGKGAQMHGKNGRDVVLKVPPGTVIYRIADNAEQLRTQKVLHTHDPYDLPVRRDDVVVPAEVVAAETMDELASEETAESPAEGAKKYPWDREAPIFMDLVEAGTRVTLCKGGKGGRGNVHWKSPSHRTPREFEFGRDGEAGIYWLVVKSIADVGLVGYPNAGKSTLLSRLSNAKPKIAAYPFTTLNPIIGTLEFDNFKKIMIADIPGLIEGAHDNIGLGHEFLRHIERCKMLLFVVDMAGSEGRKPWEDFAQVRKELKLYSSELAKKKAIVVANKMDMPGAEEFLSDFKKICRLKVIPVSALERTGTEMLKGEIYNFIYKNSKK
ncbi:MAG: GTPase ObgE [Verrucomicrobiae bacterium]|nr:GTPase ObgE [Verrucomicrobiae bacterium]